MILFDITANRVNAGNTRHRLQLRRHDPILHRPQVCRLGFLILQTIAFRGQVGAIGLPSRLAGSGFGDVKGRKFHGPHVDLAQPCRERPHGRRHSRGKIFPGCLQTLRHLLPSEINVRLFSKNGGDLGQTVD